MNKIEKYYDLSSSEDKREELYSEYKERKKDIEDEFFKKTKLDRKDINFLMFATFLQVMRWVLIDGKLGEKIDKDTRVSHDDKNIGDKVKEEQKNIRGNIFEKNEKVIESKKYRTAMEIAMTKKVPYDATKNSKNFNLNIEGAYHRVHTLGHDPLLGWIFGTANIITDTMTLDNFRSFNINMNNGLNIENETFITKVFTDTFESLNEDYKRLPAAIFAQGLHLYSDKYTKLGLPVPILSSFSPELAGKLYKEQYDYLCMTRDLKTIGMQAGFSILINMIIS